MVKFGERILLMKSKSFDDAVDEALKMTPTAGRQVGQPSDETPISFGSLGGLKEVKQQLREIFLWQNKYSKLYVKCGLRIGGGAILYGPSGCGKSLCMRAVATESKLPVISIKGPELLSKYIGASEQNVRSVFERARAAKPCLVVFDEFDALVPKRGHDSTGVTDRVVNQFLTELDGVDSSNDGIYVIASTNRIDLIDEALLRPGRFDHKVFVGFPLENDRKEILEILTRELTVEENVDFDELAKMTENWTCAELRGLVLNANFKAMDEQGSDSVLKMSHLLAAVSESHPKQPKTKVTSHEPASRVTLA
uniref:AAA+ ATPase domain-containing protein n=1 Tax=Panagrolaimus sp. JU765 TaxID=591449 RepID=A0AC34RF51_9BILA